jgi:hypothetical protein
VSNTCSREGSAALHQLLNRSAAAQCMVTQRGPTEIVCLKLVISFAYRRFVGSSRCENQAGQSQYLIWTRLAARRRHLCQSWTLRRLVPDKVPRMLVNADAQPHRPRKSLLSRNHSRPSSSTLRTLFPESHNPRTRMPGPRPWHRSQSTKPKSYIGSAISHCEEDIK